MITNSEAVFDPNNNGFYYICKAEDGTFWIREVSGTWKNVTSIPLTFKDIFQDFTDVVVNKGATLTEAELIQKSKDGILIKNPPKDDVPVITPTPPDTASSTPIF